MITVEAAVVVVTLGSVVLVVDDELDELDDELDELDDELDELVVVTVPPSALVFIATSLWPDPQLVEFEHSNPTSRM